MQNSEHAVEREDKGQPGESQCVVTLCCEPVQNSMFKYAKKRGKVFKIQCTSSQSIEVKCVFNICAVCLVAAGVRIQVMMRHKLLATKLMGAVLVGNNMGNMVMVKMKMGATPV